MEKNIVPIVFAFDNRLIIPACVCLSSLLMHAEDSTFYDIFILYSEREQLDTEKLALLPSFYRNCRIQYRAVDSVFDRAFQIRGINTITYYRLLIPDLIPEYDTILYSDVDVIFRSDLSSIYNKTNLEGYYLAGVKTLSHLIPEMNKYYREILRIDPSQTFYAGNLILNSAALRHDNMIEKFKDLVVNGRYKYQDMDVLNLSCAGKVYYLPPLFCLTTYVNHLMVNHIEYLYDLWNDKEIKEALKHGIIHYNGHKPWNSYCINFDIWWEYYRKSPFFDEQFYFDFFYEKLNQYDLLPLWKRVKILIRYFVYGIHKNKM